MVKDIEFFKCEKTSLARRGNVLEKGRKENVFEGSGTTMNFINRIGNILYIVRRANLLGYVVTTYP